MITPRFSCSQTDESVTISIYCPSIRASDVEIHVDETLFTLHVNPYFLRLNFSHNIVDDDASSATYDPSSGYLSVSLTKAVKAQEFQDLDLLARLLARPSNTQGPSIEVLSTDLANSGDEAETLPLSEKEEILKAAQNDWRLPQIPDTSDVGLSSQTHYGFLNMYSGYFRHVEHTENEINELGLDVETCRVDERRGRRIRNEDRKFDGEHYMADYVDTSVIEDLLKWDHPHLSDDNGDVRFTHEENEAMLKLPRKEYLATREQTHELYLTLVTLLFAYAYETRTTQHDPTPESAWTICSLTPAFSALDPPTGLTREDGKNSQEFFSQEEIRGTLVPSYRRSLAFPLYRTFAFSEACRRDVARLCSRGRRLVFRCLLEMKIILDHHEVYYVYSKIWLDDLCVWIQACASDATLAQLGVSVGETEIKKEDIGWNLEALETAARAVLERETDSDDEDRLEE